MGVPGDLAHRGFSPSPPGSLILTNISIFTHSRYTQHIISIRSSYRNPPSGRSSSLSFGRWLSNPRSFIQLLQHSINARTLPTFGLPTVFQSSPKRIRKTNLGSDWEHPLLDPLHSDPLGYVRVRCMSTNDLFAFHLRCVNQTAKIRRTS